jgi:hypothetical protein
MKEYSETRRLSVKEEGDGGKEKQLPQNTKKKINKLSAEEGERGKDGGGRRDREEAVGSIGTYDMWMG